MTAAARTIAIEILIWTMLNVRVSLAINANYDVWGNENQPEESGNMMGRRFLWYSPPSSPDSTLAATLNSPSNAPRSSDFDPQASSKFLIGPNWGYTHYGSTHIRSPSPDIGYMRITVTVYELINYGIGDSLILPSTSNSRECIEADILGNISTTSSSSRTVPSWLGCTTTFGHKGEFWTVTDILHIPSRSKY